MTDQTTDMQDAAVNFLTDAIEYLHGRDGNPPDPEGSLDALVDAAHEIENLRDALRAKDDYLSVSFTPQAIAEHFTESLCSDSLIAAWVANASDEELREVGAMCLESDILWNAFHEVLTFAIQDRMTGQ